MAKYKCLPNYELIINSKTVAKFDIDGGFETFDESKITILDALTKKSTFIKRLDAEEPKPKQPARAKAKK